MLLFIRFIISLNIYDLEIKTKNYIIFDYRSSSVCSYAYVRNFLPSESKNKNCNFFSYENEDLSEFFFYNITLDENILVENRIYIIENNKIITLNNFTISINENCEIIDVNPKFSLGIYDDNLQKIDVENIKSYSRFVWDNFLKDIINNNRKLLYFKIEIILNESINSLKFKLIDYPLLFFYNSMEKIQDVFSALLDIIKNDNCVEFSTIYDSFNKFCENENENMLMQRFHTIKGHEIINESKDFFLSCLLTDILNIVKFIKNNNQYIFKIFNFIEFKNILYGESYIACEVNIDYKKIKRDSSNNPSVYLYDTFKNEVKNYFYINCNNKFIIMLNKIWCLNNNLDKFKIIIHTDAKIYESQYLDIKNELLV
ncbi:hypothetical protein NAPIS_ORF02757 [Vairimorpha apis BRL 01]|uniref:Uncharacterized protein n=1 Tax=Vairimorpha apis BRL 01 TaxID=1037528 RepID=T0L4J6_9MICR|nr:hypothetical protein NAPIS_ORF02757 [Vairimorpha apis BRL 01]